uniref:Putative Cytochrome c, class I n=1 Tax=Magnetococcus massalia (strain MO-1) TaxID=451514 RepID=A0A1S7LL55_MAGMO|nr:putative Cytochrome c, class I [Candidatus Magnetococcus massalia]
MMSSIARTTGFVMLAALLTGCGGSNEYKPQAGATAETIYAEACASCHGDKGAGKLGPILRIAGSDADPAATSAKIAGGGHIMPGFPNISEQDRMAVAVYLKAQK